MTQRSRVTFHFLLFIALLCVSVADLPAQSGGPYAITQSVIAAGGAKSDGGPYSITGTAGQPSAGGRSSLDIYDIRGGFWQSDFAPTAAPVSISGRVLTLDGRGLMNAVVVLTERSGTSRTARTGPFGYYRFDDVEAGQTLIFDVRSKLYQFAPQVVSVTDNIAELDFTPLGQNLPRRF